jgi:hypothetical protein
MMISKLFTTATIFIILLASGCATRSEAPAAKIDFSLSHASDEKRFMVAIRPMIEPPPVNQIHNWEIKVTNPKGEPVQKALFYIGGGMPDHGHGFPTSPRVVREPSPGTYVLDGVKFNMNGRWEIKLAIQAGEVFDIVTFNTIVPLPAVVK